VLQLASPKLMRTLKGAGHDHSCQSSALPTFSAPHHELRAALRLAGMQIRKLNLRDDPLLQILRRTLRDARPVARHFSEAQKTEILRGFTVTRSVAFAPASPFFGDVRTPDAN
jgi:hypothetical protein